MLSKPRHVGVLIGSLRRGSLSRKLAKALIARAPATLDCHIIEIGDLPLYNEDLDSSPPPAWVSFRAALEACDALLFVTQVAPYATGPAGVHGVLDQAAVGVAQVAELHGLAPRRVDDVRTLVPELRLPQPRHDDGTLAPG
jgi:hypothetical protein